MHATIIKGCKFTNNNSLETEVYLKGAYKYTYIYTHALRICMHYMHTLHYIALHCITYIHTYIHTYMHIFVFYLSIYLRVYSLHHNVLPTLQSIPLMTHGPLYPITQDSSCHGQHTMPQSPWSFPWPVPQSSVCMNVCVLQWRKVCVVIL